MLIRLFMVLATILAAGWFAPAHAQEWEITRVRDAKDTIIPTGVNLTIAKIDSQVVDAMNVQRTAMAEASARGVLNVGELGEWEVATCKVAQDKISTGEDRQYLSSCMISVRIPDHYCYGGSDELRVSFDPTNGSADPRSLSFIHVETPSYPRH